MHCRSYADRRCLRDCAVGLLQKQNQRAVVIFYVARTHNVFVPCCAVDDFQIIKIGFDFRNVACTVFHTVGFDAGDPCPVGLSRSDAVFTPAALRLDADAAHIGTAVVDIEIAQLGITVQRRTIELVIVFFPARDLLCTGKDRRFAFIRLIDDAAALRCGVPRIKCDCFRHAVDAAADVHNNISGHAVSELSHGIPCAGERLQRLLFCAGIAVVTVRRNIELRVDRCGTDLYSARKLHRCGRQHQTAQNSRLPGQTSPLDSLLHKNTPVQIRKHAVSFP